MRRTWQIGVLASTLACVAMGCDATDYYPQHRPPQPQSDLTKQGPGTYGGNNSEYPVGTPGTTGAEKTAPTPGGSAAPSLDRTPGDAGLQINNGSGAFNPGDSATGRPAPSAAGSGTPVDGTTNLGTSGGH